MSYLVTLKLESARDADLAVVRAISGLATLDIDEDYGLVCISPKRRLYVLRARGEPDASLVGSVEEVVGVHGDARISPIGRDRADRTREDG